MLVFQSSELPIPVGNVALSVWEALHGFWCVCVCVGGGGGGCTLWFSPCAALALLQLHLAVRAGERGSAGGRLLICVAATSVPVLMRLLSEGASPALPGSTNTRFSARLHSFRLASLALFAWLTPTGSSSSEPVIPQLLLNVCVLKPRA